MPRNGRMEERVFVFVESCAPAPAKAARHPTERKTMRVFMRAPSRNPRQGYGVAVKRRSLVGRLALIVALTAAGASVGAQTTVIYAGALLDPATGRVERDQLIFVEGGRIRNVTPAPSRFGATANVQLLDFSKYTVLPGLIDGHVHLGIGGTPRDNAFADL